MHIMKTIAILGVVAIVATLSIVGTTIGVGILSQQAHASNCNVDLATTASKCSSQTSLANANPNGHNVHFKGSP